MQYIDMHCDTLMKGYLGFKKDIYQSKRNMVDVQRLYEAGAEAQFFAIFLPPIAISSKLGPLIPSDDKYIEKLRRILLQTIDAHPDKLAMAFSFSELEANRAAGKCSAILTIEDGRSVDGKLEKLEKYYDMGIRLISLTWNAPNCFGFPNSKDPQIMAEGLTNFGREGVARMNELGMLVDVSHLSDGGFWDVVEICKGPFVASHSNCRSLSPPPESDR